MIAVYALVIFWCKVEELNNTLKEKLEFFTYNTGFFGGMFY